MTLNILTQSAISEQKKGFTNALKTLNHFFSGLQQINPRASHQQGGGFLAVAAAAAARITARSSSSRRDRTGLRQVEAVQRGPRDRGGRQQEAETAAAVVQAPRRQQQQFRWCHPRNDRQQQQQQQPGSQTLQNRKSQFEPRAKKIYFNGFL